MCVLAGRRPGRCNVFRHISPPALRLRPYKKSTVTEWDSAKLFSDKTSAYTMWAWKYMLASGGAAAGRLGTGAPFPGPLAALAHGLLRSMCASTLHYPCPYYWQHS